jgi:DNA-binding response OmpR family regulator
MKKVKILYVEDESALGRIVKESLEVRSFEVEMVLNGREAHPRFVAVQPDICVLDVMLPYKDGFEVAAEIRATDPRIPIIFLTAKNQTSDVLKGFESGGNDFLKKPFSMEELIVRINNLLKLAGVAKGNSMKECIKIGSYEFVPSRFELRSPTGVKKLSHRESTLLLLFTERPNATVLRKDILLKLWGDDSFFNSRNLDVYITKLREYLREDSSLEIITIKGIGYHFAM